MSEYTQINDFSTPTCIHDDDRGRGLEVEVGRVVRTLAQGHVSSHISTSTTFYSSELQSYC